MIVVLTSKLGTLISDSEHRNTVISAVFALGLKVLGAGMAFLFNLIIARKLGAEQSGMFFLALSIVMLLSSVSLLGFENTVLRFTGAQAKAGGVVKKILQFALCRVIPLAIVLAFALYWLAPIVATQLFDKPELVPSLQKIAPSIIGLSVVMIFAMSLQARQMIKASIPCQNIAHFMLCGTAVLLFNIESADTAALYLSQSLSMSAAFFYWLSFKGLNSKGVPPEASELWRSARPNWVIMLMGQVVQWGSPILIGVWLASEQVAYFSVAQRVALLTSFILVAINLVVAPKFAAYYAQNDMVNIRKTALFSVRLLVVSAFPIVLFMLLFPGFLMSLFGDEFRQGAQLLQIMVLGQAVNVITGSVGYLLIMSGHERDMRLVTIISGCSMLIFVPLMTKYFGTVGAASVTAFCVAIQNLLAVFFVKKRLGFNTLVFWKKI